MQKERPKDIRASLLWCVLATAMLPLVAAPPAPPTPDPVQVEFDRFVDSIAPAMYGSGAVSDISAEPNATDEMLIAAGAQQLNNIPGPLRKWSILKKEHVSRADLNARLRKMHPELFPPGVSGPGFEGPNYLVAVIDSDQGRKIMAINEVPRPDGSHWARMYNCDAVFSSPQDGGTPLIR